MAWQDSNRLTADIMEIDREHDILKAHGHVVSQLLDKPKDQDKDNKNEKPQKAKKTRRLQTPAPCLR